jgi:hypothetical protein
MPVGSVLAGSIGTYIQDIFEDALMVARDQSLMANLVRVFTDRTGDAARKNSEYGTVDMGTIAEAADLTSQSFTPSVIATLDPGEVGAQFFISDLRLESDPFNVRTDAAMELGSSMAEKMDADLLSRFSSLTGGTVGFAGSVLTWDRFMAARARLRTQKAPPPYRAVLHEYQWYQLAKAASIAAPTASAAPSFTDAVTAGYYVGRVMDVEVFTTANLAVGTAVFGGMFSPSALALDMRRAPRLEPERDASRRGFELNMTAVYAYGVWRPKFGVAILADASAPAP